MLLLSSDNRMITMRHAPHLALLKTRISEDGREVTIIAARMDPLTIRPKQAMDVNDQIISFTCITISLTLSYNPLFNLKTSYLMIKCLRQDMVFKDGRS